MQSSMGADVEAVCRLFMALSSPGNDHQAQILHCACNLSPLQRNLPAKPGWPLAAQSAAPCVAASCRALVCAPSCASQPAGSASIHVVSPQPASPPVAHSASATITGL